MTLITTDDVVQADKCHPRSARAWALENGVKLVGGNYLWTQQELEAFCARNKTRGWKPGRPRKNFSQSS